MVKTQVYVTCDGCPANMKAWVAENAMYGWTPGGWFRADPNVLLCPACQEKPISFLKELQEKRITQLRAGRQGGGYAVSGTPESP